MDSFSTPNIVIAQSNHKKRNVAIVAIIVILILGMLSALTYLYKYGFIDPTSFPGYSLLYNYVPAPNLSDLESCDVKKEGNPLVEDYQKFTANGRRVIIGTYRGNINQINTDPFRFQLISPKADQVYNFTTLKDEKGLIFDDTTQKELKLADLELGNSIVMSFNCFPGSKSVFKITKIEITAK